MLPGPQQAAAAAAAAHRAGGFSVDTGYRRNLSEAVQCLLLLSYQ
jgi:hypothetical protein